MGEHFCILFLFRRYHLQIVLYMKLSVLKSIFGYIHLLTSPKVQSFPLLGRIRDFHPLATCTARRTLKKTLRTSLHTAPRLVFPYFSLKLRTSNTAVSSHIAYYVKEYEVFCSRYMAISAVREL